MFIDTGIRFNLLGLFFLVQVCRSIFGVVFVQGGSVQLFDYNIDDILKSNEVVLMNFYADWCRFSQMLAPVYDEVAEKINAEFPQPGKIVVAKVDSDNSKDIAERYHVSKYPTLKLFRFGKMTKKEFRGQRSVEAISEFLREQLKDAVTVHSASHDLDTLENDKSHVIGFFESTDSPNYKTFLKAASLLRDNCRFHALTGEEALSNRPSGDNIVFRGARAESQDVVYVGALDNLDSLNQWATDRCVPLVREITFENAEELTEEGIPFLILFHHPDDKEIVTTFHNEVARQLISEKNGVNFLTADGVKFAHPLHHLGKGEDDLPVLAIDSFRHMYVFPHKVRDMTKPGLLKQFVLDLHSGKLHREFHNGPDPTDQPPQIHVADTDTDEETPKPSQHVPKAVSDDQEERDHVGDDYPPESAFAKLAPSHTRYTFRDEL